SLTLRRPLCSTIFPYTTLFRSSVYKGKGYMDSNDSLILEPFDFSTKNYLPISSLHSIMKRVIFPEAFSEEEQFHLKGSDREFVLDRKSTRLNSSHVKISYAVFC